LFGCPQPEPVKVDDANTDEVCTNKYGVVVCSPAPQKDEYIRPDVDAKGMKPLW